MDWIALGAPVPRRATPRVSRAARAVSRSRDLFLTSRPPRGTYSRFTIALRTHPRRLIGAPDRGQRDENHSRRVVAFLFPVAFRRSAATLDSPVSPGLCARSSVG